MAATLPRELIKWLQSLDLTWSVKNAQWDISNGYLVAEILSWYYPREVEMCLYQNVSSLHLRMANWMQLRKFMKRRQIQIPDEYIDAVIHCKQGGAALFLQTLYEILTNRRLKVPPADPPIDFTDHTYQAQLPEHARSTAVQAIRTNLKATELIVYNNITTKRLLAQAIVNRHTEDRAVARQMDPGRYGHRPTIGELAERQPPPPVSCSTAESSNWNCNAGQTDGGVKDCDAKVDETEAELGYRSVGVHFSTTDHRVIDIEG